MQLNVLQEHFLTIGMAKVSTSAYEAFDLGLLQKGKDVVVVNKDRQIAVAKQHAQINERCWLYTTDKKNRYKSTWKTSLRNVFSGYGFHAGQQLHFMNMT